MLPGLAFTSGIVRLFAVAENFEGRRVASFETQTHCKRIAKASQTHRKRIANVVIDAQTSVSSIIRLLVGAGRRYSRTGGSFAGQIERLVSNIEPRPFRLASITRSTMEHCDTAKWYRNDRASRVESLRYHLQRTVGQKKCSYIVSRATSLFRC